jgi:hypothetical protein
MKAKSLILAALLGLSTALSGTAAAQMLTPDGYGRIHFGERLDAVEKRLGQRAAPRPADPACAIVRFKRYPRVSFMVEQGVITRADARTIIRNSAGITARMSARDALRHQRALRAEPHKYDEHGQYLVLAQGNDKALIFETSHGKLQRMRAGLKPAVDYVESCL